MGSFALVDCSRPAVREQILIIVDDRKTADEMAWELRRRGHPIEVREVDDEVIAHGPRPRPSRPIG